MWTRSDKYDKILYFSRVFPRRAPGVDFGSLLNGFWDHLRGQVDLQTRKMAIRTPLEKRSENKRREGDARKPGSLWNGGLGSLKIN